MPRRDAMKYWALFWRSGPLVLITFTGSSVSRRSGRLGVHGVFTSLKLSPLSIPFYFSILLLRIYLFPYLHFFFLVSVLCGGIIWNFLGDPFWWYQLNSYRFSVLSWSLFFFVIVSTSLIFSSGLFYMVNVSNSDQSGFVLQHIAITLDLSVAMIRRRHIKQPPLYALPRGPKWYKMEGWAYHVLWISIG